MGDVELQCDICHAFIADYQTGLHHYSGVLNGAYSGHIHICSMCKRSIGLQDVDFDKIRALPGVTMGDLK